MPDVEVLPDAAALAADVAARTLTTLASAQGSDGRAVLALTAGSIMEKVWTALAASADAGSVDWSRVDVYWGDERFVAHDSSDRNDVPAEQGLFAAEPFSSATRLSMPASDGAQGADLDAAAAAYGELIAGVDIDVLLLGMGPDGHCCSLFPHHAGLTSTDAVVAVRESPKPPPERLSFSFATLARIAEIWVVASGDGKADAVAEALRDGDREATPVIGAVGRTRTLWLLDADAASKRT